MAVEQTRPAEAPNVGVPFRDFEAAVNTLEALQRSGKFQIFLGKENIIRVVGETDEFRIALGKQLGIEPIEKRKAQECLEEVQTFLQVLLATGKGSTAAEVFESQVFDEEFEKLKDNPEPLDSLRDSIRNKLELVSEKLTSDALLERRRRLASAVGPIFEDVDVEVISKRKSLAHGVEIDAPFLKIRLLYTKGGQTRFPFSPPPWITNLPRDCETFDLECDETDIDLMVSRLLQAKELLRKTIDAKVQAKASEEK